MTLRQLIIRTILVLLLFPFVARAEYAHPFTSTDQVYRAKNDTAAIIWWHFDDGVKIGTHWFCGDPRKLPNGFGDFSIKSLFSSLKVTRPCTKAELDLGEQSFLAGNRLKAFVSNPQSTTAPTYFANADGTKGPLTGIRVPVKSECNWQMRLVTITNGVKKGTSYYAVIDEGGQYHKDHIYATCKLGAIAK